MSGETIEESQRVIQNFVDRYGTHVNRALITGKHMVETQHNLEIYIMNSVGVLPFGFMDHYNAFIEAYNRHMESLALILEDWRYLVSDDV